MPEPLPEFTAIPGINKKELLLTKDPWKFFSSILDEEFFKQVAYFTNEYARVKKRK